MIDRELAVEIVERLNKLVANKNVARVLKELIEVRITVELRNHATIQTVYAPGSTSEEQVGFLGVLNGLVGTIPGGKFDGWGYIAACYSNETSELVGFQITDESVKEISNE